MKKIRSISFFWHSRLLLGVALVSVCFFLASGQAFAAEISVTSSQSSVVSGSQYTESVFISTDDATINGVQGTLTFPSDLLDVVQVQDGNSGINFWLKQPSVDSPGVISFSGVTPGGFNGSKIFLFSVVFHASAIGMATVTLQDIEAALNDGKATLAPVTIDASQVSVIAPTAPPPSPIGFAAAASAEPGTGPDISSVKAPVDTTPPEAFTPVVTSFPGIYQGEHFLVFSAEDKGVGIDHYEICEDSTNNCVTAVSPYLLKDQSLSQPILVKAFDKDGNERDVVVLPQHPKKWYENGYIVIPGIFLILLMLIIIDILFFKKAVQNKVWKLNHWE